LEGEVALSSVCVSMGATAGPLTVRIFSLRAGGAKPDIAFSAESDFDVLKQKFPC
jgi:hypothetical protein